MSDLVRFSRRGAEHAKVAEKGNENLLHALYLDGRSEPAREPSGYTDNAFAGIARRLMMLPNDNGEQRRARPAYVIKIIGFLCVLRVLRASA